MQALEEKKTIGQLFDKIAGTYDTFNHLLSLNIDKRWRRKAVNCLDKADKLLDVAIGTADLSIEVMKQGKADSIHGIDLSDQMMKIGMEKVEKKNLGGKITFQNASALDMPFDSASYDILTCAYGVRNFSDLEKGLQEFNRVLKPGGQLMILEFSYPENKFIRALYDFFFTNIMPVAGKFISKDPAAYTYFRNSVKGFIWGEEMAEKIRKAGFQCVSFKTMTFGISTVYLARK